jgi:hypothetical protein
MRRNVAFFCTLHAEIRGKSGKKRLYTEGSLIISNASNNPPNQPILAALKPRENLRSSMN